jgi:hypothetical protein
MKLIFRSSAGLPFPGRCDRNARGARYFLCSQAPLALLSWMGLKDMRSRVSTKPTSAITILAECWRVVSWDQRRARRKLLSAIRYLEQFRNSSNEATSFGPLARASLARLNSGFLSPPAARIQFERNDAMKGASNSEPRNSTTQKRRG